MKLYFLFLMRHTEATCWVSPHFHKVLQKSNDLRTCEKEHLQNYKINPQSYPGHCLCHLGSKSPKSDPLYQGIMTFLEKKGGGYKIASFHPSFSKKLYHLIHKDKFLPFL